MQVAALNGGGGGGAGACVVTGGGGGVGVGGGGSGVGVGIGVGAGDELSTGSAVAVFFPFETGFTGGVVWFFDVVFFGSVGVVESFVIVVTVLDGATGVADAVVVVSFGFGSCVVAGVDFSFAR